MFQYLFASSNKGKEIKIIINNKDANKIIYNKKKALSRQILQNKSNLINEIYTKYKNKKLSSLLFKIK